MNNKIYGILVLIMFTWGINFAWMKIIISAGDALTIQGTRVFLGGVVVFVLMLLMKQKVIVKNMPWKFILIGCFFGVICHHGFFAMGIQQTTAVKSSIIGGLSPLLTALVAVIFKDTVMTRTKWIGFSLGAAGVIIAFTTSLSTFVQWQMGDLFIFLSFFLQAFSFIAIRHATKEIPSIVVTAWMLVIGSSILMISSFIINPQHFEVFTQVDSTWWMYFLLSAVLATGIGHTLYNLCIKKIGAAESAIFTNLSTLFGLILSAIVLNEGLKNHQLLGCLVIICGVLIATGNVERLIKWRKHRKITLKH